MPAGVEEYPVLKFGHAPPTATARARRGLARFLRALGGRSGGDLSWADNLAAYIAPSGAADDDDGDDFGHIDLDDDDDEDDELPAETPKVVALVATE